MRNTIILAIVLFVAVLSASVFYFRNLDKDHNLAAKPLRLLPDNTLLIVSMHNNEITDNIFKDFEVFDAILGFNSAQQLSEMKERILRHEKLAEFVLDTELYFSFHPERERSQMLITVPVSKPLTPADLSQVWSGIGESYALSTIDTLDTKMYRISTAADSAWYAIYHQNTIFASESVGLLAQILDKSVRRLPDDQIDFFLKSNSRNTPLSVYFPHQQFDSVANLYQRRGDGVFLDLFQKLYGQSAWNINFKQDALILTGESETDQYSENYIGLFKSQQKTEQYLYNYFPGNTAVYMEYAVSDRSQFQRDLRDLFKRREEVMSTDTTGLTQGLNETLGDAFGFVETANQNYIGFIHRKDSLAWEKFQQAYMETVNDSISRFKTSQVLYNHFGDAFRAFTRPYLTVVDSIIVVANSAQTLRIYRDDWSRRNLLIGTLGFKNFEKLQGNEANVTFFVHTSNAYNKILNSLPTHFQRNFRDKENFSFQDFYSWSAQFSGNNGKFSSQLYAVYKSKNALGVTPEWVYDFGDRAITQPYVFEHSDTSKFILIQELNHTIHAIHPSGTNMWSVVFSGRVVGDIQQLPDRSIVLVTDRNRLYRFDTAGKPLPGFSVSLPEEPTHTPTITQINGMDAILVSTEDRVLAYGFDGNKLDGWGDISFSAPITGPIMPFGNQSIVATSDGNVYFLGPNGSIVREAALPASTAVRNPVGVISGNNQAGQIVLTDTLGVLYRWSDNEASWRPYQVEGLSSSHMSDFKSVIAANSSEMIVLDNSLLEVYDISEGARPAFSYHFTKAITDRPQYFVSPADRNQRLIGISSRPTRLVYLFQPNGTLMEGFPVVGQPLFYYGDINYNSGSYLLVMRSDHKLYAFKHQK